MAKQQKSLQATQYVRGEDSFRIAYDSTPDQVHQWAENWFYLWTFEVCLERRVERFIDCCSRLAAVAELNKFDPAPLLIFIQEVGEASLSGRKIPSKLESHLLEAQHVVERVDSLAKGQIVQAETAKPQIPDEANRRPEVGKGKQATVAARMIDLIKDPTTHTWTCRQFAVKLNCKPPTVVATAAWKQLAVARESARLEQAIKAYKKGLDVKVDKRRLPKRKKRPDSLDD